MIVSSLGFDPAVLAGFLAWSAVMWILGVSYAAYRAVSWADRIRVWAHTVDIPTELEEPCSSTPQSS